MDSRVWLLFSRQDLSLAKRLHRADILTIVFGPTYRNQAQRQNRNQLDQEEEKENKHGKLVPSASLLHNPTLAI